MALGDFGWMISVIFILIFMVLMRAEHMKTQQYLTLRYPKFSQHITDT
jgi:type II secretory pathway component PulF